MFSRPRGRCRARPAAKRAGEARYAGIAKVVSRLAHRAARRLEQFDGAARAHLVGQRPIRRSFRDQPPAQGAHIDMELVSHLVEPQQRGPRPAENGPYPVGDAVPAVQRHTLRVGRHRVEPDPVDADRHRPGCAAGGRGAKLDFLVYPDGAEQIARDGIEKRVVKIAVRTARDQRFEGAFDVDPKRHVGAPLLQPVRSIPG